MVEVAVKDEDTWWLYDGDDDVDVDDRVDEDDVDVYNDKDDLAPLLLYMSTVAAYWHETLSLLPSGDKQLLHSGSASVSGTGQCAINSRFYSVSSTQLRLYDTVLLGSGLRSFLTGDEEYHMTAYSKVHTYDDDDTWGGGGGEW